MFVKGVIIIILITAIYGSYQKTFYIFRFIIIIFFFFILPGLLISFYNSLIILSKNTSFLYLFLIGCCIGFPFNYLLKKHLNVLFTFEHEAAHVIFALLMLKKIKKFVVTNNNGGYVIARGGIKGELPNMIYTLAPYFCPLFVFILILFRPIFVEKNIIRSIYDILIGIFWIHGISFQIYNLKNSWHKQKVYLVTGQSVWSDIASMGYIYSFISILTLSIITYSILINIIVFGYAVNINITIDIFIDSLSFYKLKLSF